ncbi:hypothetical protein [Streptomyces coelicoflavus]|uniref:hypothetical protein n=1 Tax=Streptomyces coelicoflavus TaxID=285562 RepID=UPI001EF18145|nr:hypothetical protein [Streptomyces coelicoflavus]
MADWGIRPASTADVEAVADLRTLVLRADLERLGRYDAQRVRQRLRDGSVPAHTWVIEVDGAFAGCVALRPAGDAHTGDGGRGIVIVAAVTDRWCVLPHPGGRGRTVWLECADDAARPKRSGSFRRAPAT